MNAIERRETLENDNASECAHELRERLARTVESAKAACRQLEEKAKEGAKATDKVIRDHPYQSIGIALCLGVVVGALITRKQMSQL